jgi:hypothetical protein
MSEDDALTTLATRLEELAREVGEAGEQRARDHKDIAAAKTALAKWNARVEVEVIGPGLAMRRDIKNLRTEVLGLSAAAKGALDSGKAKAPLAPRWDNLDQDQEAEQLARLSEWVNGFLRVQYPGYRLTDCWANHREALWELGALHAEWLRIFGDPRGADLESMLWFHERWLAGTLGRLSRAITCTSFTSFDCQATRTDQRGRRTAGR